MSGPSNFVTERRKIIDRFRDEGRFEEALQVCEEMIAADSGDYAAYSERADILYSIGQRKEAYQDLGRLIQLRPESPSAYYVRAKWNLEVGDYQAVLDDATTIMRFRDKHFIDVAYFYRAIAQFKLGNKTDAVADCLRLPADFKMPVDIPQMGWKVLSRKELQEMIGG